MFAKIRHVAIYTDNYERTAKFYQTIFGMKKLTTGHIDDVGRQDRGHISDGVMGLAILPRPAGIQLGGVDHFGFEVEDVRVVLDRLKRYYPDVLVARALEGVPFAGLRSHDPAGSQFDLSQQGMANVREGYAQEGWDQPRRLSHIAIRASKPALVAEFYQKVFELKEAEALSSNGSICLTDGKVRLLIRPCDNSLYRGLREGVDHIGFKVENLEEAKKDLEKLSASLPQSAARKIAVGRHGQFIQKDLEACKIGEYATADPDGVLLDLSEK